jgi:hypothetical protein
VVAGTSCASAASRRKHASSECEREVECVGQWGVVDVACCASVCRWHGYDALGVEILGSSHGDRMGEKTWLASWCMFIRRVYPHIYLIQELGREGRRIRRSANTVFVVHFCQHMVLGGLPVLALSIWNQDPGVTRHVKDLSLEDWAYLFYVSVFGSAIAFGLFFYNATRGT